MSLDDIQLDDGLFSWQELCTVELFSTNACAAFQSLEGLFIRTLRKQLACISEFAKLDDQP